MLILHPGHEGGGWTATRQENRRNRRRGAAFGQHDRMAVSHRAASEATKAAGPESGGAEFRIVFDATRQGRMGSSPGAAITGTVGGRPWLPAMPELCPLSCENQADAVQVRDRRRASSSNGCAIRTLHRARRGFRCRQKGRLPMLEIVAEMKTPVAAPSNNGQHLEMACGLAHRSGAWTPLFPAGKATGHRSGTGIS